MTSQFGALLRQARGRAEMTQEELAERSGVGVRTIRGLETGDRTDPRATTVRLLADALRLTFEERGRLLAVAVGDPATSPVTTPLTRNDLPGDIADFTGRATEMDRLLTTIPAEEAGGTAVVIEAIDGMAGVGKTTLAVHLAHRLADRYPDAQLFVDLHGHTAERKATDPAAALDVLLRALGMPGDRIPADLDQRAALWRAELAERKVLVVLDNAASAAQVRPLLPGTPGCLALVTSRRRLVDLDTSHVVSLDVLAVEDAIALFEGVAGADRVAAQRDAVAELVRLCGYLPLAVRVAAARLRSRTAWTLGHLAARLREGQRALSELTAGDRSVAAAFALSYQYLDADQQRLFRLLGLHPGAAFDTYAAASLIGASVAKTERLLEDLVDVHLLQELTPGRFRFHDLLHYHAHDTAHAAESPARRDDALRRLIDFYLHTAHTADLLLYPHRERIRLDPPSPGCPRHPLSDVSAALAWFDAEHAAVVAAQNAAAARGWHQAVAALAWTLDTFHYRRGHRHHRLAACQAGLAAAEALPDPTTRSLAHRSLGLAYADLERHEEAVAEMHESLALAEQHHDATRQARTHHALAVAWGRQGDDRRALEHATHALTLYRTLDNPVWEADALTNLGWYAARLGEYERATEHCETALILLRRNHDAEGEAETLDSLGYIAHRTGQHQQAINYYEHALTLYRDLGHAYEVATSLASLGRPYLALGRRDHARAVWREALELYEQQERHEDVERVQGHLDALDAQGSA